MVAQVKVRDGDVPMGLTQIEDGDAKVLFVRDATGLRAFQASCPHYGAPLAKGKLCGHTLYCPWHKAAFNVGDGALLQPPALHGLEQYPITIEGEKVVATLEPMAEAKPSTRATDTRTFLVVGTGAAAVAAVTTLRHEGFGGRIVMIGREPGVPYDRPKLSKNFMAKKTDPSQVSLEPDFFTKHAVEFVAGLAVRIEPASKSVTLKDGKVLTGDALLVATGSRAVVPNFAGGDLENIFTLRSLVDAVALSDASENGKTVTIIGGGFIGLEAAAFLTKRGLAATVVSPEEVPLAARFGDDVARAIKIYHESTGIRFIEGKVARFDGEGAVREVHLEGGRTIATDLVLIGVGAAPETEAIVGLDKREDGGIDVDSDLRVTPGVWLAGDIAAFPDVRSGTLARIEHWRLAEQHGAYAARGMLGDTSAFVAAPFFWSNQGDKRLDYAGYAPNWDEIVIQGDPAKLDFIAYYIHGGKALAACAIGHNPQMIDFLHALDQGRPPSARELRAADLAA